MIVGSEGCVHVGLDDIGSPVLIPKVVDTVSIPVRSSGVMEEYFSRLFPRS